MSILFEHVTAVTMDPSQPLLQDAYVLVEGKRIATIGLKRPQGSFQRVVDGRGQVMLPGLVNAHTHLPMTLMRGYGGGCDLQTWLNQYIFPAEDKLDSRCVRAGTALAVAELISCGVTCVADMYYFCPDIAQVVAESGISANLSRSVTCFSPVDNPSEFVSCREMQALYDQWHGWGDGQILVDASIHAEYTSYACPTMWEYLGRWAADRNVGMQIHISETKAEHEDCLTRHGKTPMALFDQYGVWQARGVAAHCVWVSPMDLEIMAQRGVTAVHNPVSNLKLASGVAPVPALCQAGVNVALGTDGVASNNSHDLFEEIKLAALLHKGIQRDPTVISAHQALEMATVNGAKALGRPDTGVLAPGNVADLILIDFSHPGLTPCHDTEENLVYSAHGSHVTMNMARGKVIYEKGSFLTLDMERIRAEVKEYALPHMFKT
ncbi:MAG: amidohydrolase family protein [Lawsonibacter sp.]|jgi:5-methylthioadenosine/S-adenosylhomocysteine deaminase